MIVRPNELRCLLQVSRSTLWRWERDNADFPRRIKLGKRSTGWLRVEIDAWVASRERVGDPSGNNGGGQDE